MARGRMITIGSFDGIHRGHAALINRTVREGRLRNLKTLALTFDRPPRTVLEHKESLGQLTSPAEKAITLRRMGVSEVKSLHFDARLARVGPFSFFRDFLLKKYMARGLVVGLDFRFGFKRSGRAVDLVRWGQEFEIPVWVIPPVKSKGMVISSTRIRKDLQRGHLKRVQESLGHPFPILGIVQKGRGVGKKLGFPTANLKVEPEKLLPKGVFAIRGWFLHPKQRIVRPHRLIKGVCNIGVRPTLLKRSKVTVEAHFFVKKGSLAGKTIYIELLHRIRPERRFPSVEALKKRITQDIKTARKFFKKQA